MSLYRGTNLLDSVHLGPILILFLALFPVGACEKRCSVSPVPRSIFLTALLLVTCAFVHPDAVAQDQIIPLVWPPTVCIDASSELSCYWSNSSGSCTHSLAKTFDPAFYSCTTAINNEPVAQYTYLMGCGTGCRIITKTLHCNVNFTMNPSCTEADPSDENFNFFYVVTRSMPACSCGTC